mmetsp:Transcript_38929/g.82915  ORF Transcript_38929/g.82915 Transcript_38929/m.82915 type:complete len:884 (-) Transcript_38929:11-2662(-)
MRVALLALAFLVALPAGRSVCSIHAHSACWDLPLGKAYGCPQGDDAICFRNCTGKAWCKLPVGRGQCQCKCGFCAVPPKHGQKHWSCERDEDEFHVHNEERLLRQKQSGFCDGGGADVAKTSSAMRGRGPAGHPQQTTTTTTSTPCCESVNSTCLACKNGTTVEAFCADRFHYMNIPGCQPETTTRTVTTTTVKTTVTTTTFTFPPTTEFTIPSVITTASPWAMDTAPAVDLPVSCCSEETAECLSCKSRMTVPSYCIRLGSANIPGCAPKEIAAWHRAAETTTVLTTRTTADTTTTDTTTSAHRRSKAAATSRTRSPRSADVMCCQAMTVECLACARGQSVEEYCADDERVGAEGCKAMAAVEHTRVGSSEATAEKTTTTRAELVAQEDSSTTEEATTATDEEARFDERTPVLEATEDSTTSEAKHSSQREDAASTTEPDASRATIQTTSDATARSSKTEHTSSAEDTATTVVAHTTTDEDDEHTTTEPTHLTTSRSPKAEEAIQVQDRVKSGASQATVEGAARDEHERSKARAETTRLTTSRSPKKTQAEDAASTAVAESTMEETLQNEATAEPEGSKTRVQTTRLTTSKLLQTKQTSQAQVATTTAAAQTTGEGTSHDEVTTTMPEESKARTQTTRLTTSRSPQQKSTSTAHESMTNVAPKSTSEGADRDDTMATEATASVATSTTEEAARTYDAELARAEQGILAEADHEKRTTTELDVAKATSRAAPKKEVATSTSAAAATGKDEVRWWPAGQEEVKTTTVVAAKWYVHSHSPEERSSSSSASLASASRLYGTGRHEPLLGLRPLSAVAPSLLVIVAISVVAALLVRARQQRFCLARLGSESCVEEAQGLADSCQRPEANRAGVLVAGACEGSALLAP